MYPNAPERQLAKFVFIFTCLFWVLSTPGLQAEPLEKAVCKKLIEKHQEFLRQGIAKKLARGHEWASANLTDVELKQIRLFLLNEEKIIFRCPQNIKMVARNPALSNSTNYVEPAKIVPKPIGPAIEIPASKPEAYRTKKGSIPKEAAKTEEAAEPNSEGVEKPQQNKISKGDAPGTSEANKPDSKGKDGLSKLSGEPKTKFVKGNADAVSAISKPSNKNTSITDESAKSDAAKNGASPVPAPNEDVSKPKTDEGNKTKKAAAKLQESGKPKPRKIKRRWKKKVRKKEESPHKLFFSQE